MSPVLKSKSKDMSSGKSIKEQQKASIKPSPSRVNGGNVLSSAYNPASGTFHSLESAPSAALPASQSNIWFPQIHEADDQSRSSLDTAADCDSVSNNGSGSGESDDPKDKVTGIATATRPGTPIPGCDVDKRDKIRQKNEKKHQRQREKRAQELHERCSSFLMTRKLETLSQKLVPMGFPVTQATQALILNEGRIEDSVSWLLSEGKHVDAAIVDDGRPLKIDISEELATISDLEVKFKCSKQEVERLVISHEGDLEKSLLDLKMQKLETHVGAASQKVEDSSGRALANGTNKVTGSPQNPVTRLQPIKSAPAINIQHPQPREDRDINRSKMVTEDGSRNPQSLRGLQAKTEWIRPQTSVPPMEHRWSTSSPSPSVSHTNLASQHAQAMLSAKSAAQYALTNNEINNGLKPIIMMQRPQSMTKQNLVTTAGATGICTSPPLNAGRYSNGVSNMEMMSLEQKIGRIALNSQNRDFHPSNPLYFQPNHLQSSVANLTNNGAAAAAETLWGNASTRWGSLRPPKNPCRTLESSPGWSSTNSSNVPPMLDYTSIDWSHGSTPQFRHNSMANLKMDRLHETWSTSFMGRCNGLEESGAILLANGSSASMASKMWTSPFAGNDLFGVSRKSVASSPTPQERGL